MQYKYKARFSQEDLALFTVLGNVEPVQPIPVAEEGLIHYETQKGGVCLCKQGNSICPCIFFDS
ncbi:hypothetical protein D3C85_1837130 [compost metagenome]